MEFFYILVDFIFCIYKRFFWKGLIIYRLYQTAKGTGKFTPYQSKGRQLRGKIKFDLDRAGEEKKYFKSQDKSGCNAHFHRVWSP